MADESDKPLSEGQTDNYGEDAEAPLIPQPLESGTQKHHTKEKTHATQRYIRPALDGLHLLLGGILLIARWIGSVMISPQFWTAAATVVIAVATVFYTIYAKRQWKEIHDGSTDTHTLALAAKEQADTAAASLRPWIKIATVELRPGAGPIRTLTFHWPLTGAVMPPTLQVKVSMLNVGHSPAQDVDVWTELFFGKFMSDKWYEVVTNEEQRFCKSVIDREATSAANIVFPSDPLESNMGVGGIVHEADTAASLILCVNYKGAGKVRYQTQALSGLYEDNRVFITVGRDMDADRLRLIREPNGDHAN